MKILELESRTELKDLKPTPNLKGGESRYSMGWVTALQARGFSNFHVVFGICDP